MRSPRFRVWGQGDCRAIISNMTGRPIRAFYQEGIEEYKIRNVLDVWPVVGLMETGESVVLRAPCDERQVVVGVAAKMSVVRFRTLMRFSSVRRSVRVRPLRSDCVARRRPPAIWGMA